MLGVPPAAAGGSRRNPSRAFRAAAAALCALLAGGLSAADPARRNGGEAAVSSAQAGGPLPIPTQEERWQVLKSEQHPAEPPAPMIEGAAAGVDALHYDLALRFDSQTRTISGSVTGQYEVATAGLTTLVLNFYDNMTVSSVTLGATPLAFTRGGNLVTITLDRPYAAGEVIEVNVAYSGSPQKLGFGSFDWSSHRGKPIFASLSEPTYGPTWWPSVDDPADKVTADMHFTVEPALVAVSNGTLMSAVTQPDGWITYHWRESYPISPYLISIACSNYDTFAHAYTPLAGGAPMEIRYWVYPELYGAAQVSFASTPTILSTYASLFGEYPFLAEKYALALFTFGGGMEHQTATSLGAMLVTGTNQFDWLIAHETAHQWWGDSLTLTDWRDTWLHEGFATHGEALYYEAMDGAAAYHSYMTSLWHATFSGPVYDNPSRFGITVYDKGAWVLHMLRHVIGDTTFFYLLRTYHADHAYSNVTTEVFRAAAEARSGQDLSWFFQEWVYSATDRPVYRWGWTTADTGAGYVVHVRIDQTQSGTIYRMPLDIRIATPAGTVDAVLWSDATSHDFAIAAPAPPSSVALDPDDWVLNGGTIVPLADGDADGVPDTADNCLAVSNPSQANADNDAMGDSCDPDADNDGVLNAADCAPLDAGAFALPLEVPALTADGAVLTWDDLASQAGPGVRYDLIRGDAGTLAGGGVGAASCLASGHPAPALTDPASPPGGACFYYLVRARNACGNGGYGTSSTGVPRYNAACP